MVAVGFNPRINQGGSPRVAERRLSPSGFRASLRDALLSHRQPRVETHGYASDLAPRGPQCGYTFFETARELF